MIQVQENDNGWALLKELKYRGLVERTLIVAPGHLKNQWRRELKEKFFRKISGG